MASSRDPIKAAIDNLTTELTAAVDRLTTVVGSQRGRDMNLVWRKSTWSTPGGSCVELASLGGGGVALRNSRAPRVELYYTRDEMIAFLRSAKAGEFDDLVLDGGIPSNE